MYFLFFFFSPPIAIWEQTGSASKLEPGGQQGEQPTVLPVFLMMACSSTSLKTLVFWGKNRWESQQDIFLTAPQFSRTLPRPTREPTPPPQGQSPPQTQDPEQGTPTTPFSSRVRASLHFHHRLFLYSFCFLLI